MPSAPTPMMRKKLLYGVFLFVLAATIYIVINLFSVSVVKAEYYRAKANNQQMKSHVIHANRGTIYDKNGKIFAQSSTVWNVIMSPSDINSYDKEQKEQICKELVNILGVDYDKTLSAANDVSKSYYIVKSKIDKPTADKITKMKSDMKLAAYSVSLQEDSKRAYPNDELASNVIGFTNYENQGIYGIEAQYNDYLEGTDGRLVVSRDASGKAMPYDSEMRYPAMDGNSIMLTIDEVVQHYLEKSLASTISQHKVANRATAIIMNAKTGGILAMATSPSYDLNFPSALSDNDQEYLKEYERECEDNEELDLSKEQIEELLEKEESRLRETQWKNKAITELYYPGSVFKTITCASALEERVVALDSSFSCSGVVDVAGTKIHCWNLGGHGSSNLTEAITKSCNPAFINIGNRLGKDKFCDYFEAFGFTEKTGIDLPGEASSLYVQRKNMGVVELASSSFGQTNKITPIQMIAAYAATVNGGYLLTPYVVEKILDSEGNVIKTNERREKRQVISEQTSETMRSILESVVTTNGGTNAYIPGYKIGGKSGTSQKLDDYSNENMRYVSTFCAFTPANDPEYVMLVVVDEPMGGQYYGSAVAAPVVSSVFKDSLEYLGIYAQYTAEEQEHQDTTVPYVIGKASLATETSLNSQGLQAEFVGSTEGTKVIYTVPPAGAVIPKNGTVVIYMEETDQKTVVVPNVIGMSVTDANTIFTNAGINIRLSGGAVDNSKAKATVQSIEPGTEVAKGTVVEVTFVVNDETG